MPRNSKARHRKNPVLELFYNQLSCCRTPLRGGVRSRPLLDNRSVTHTCTSSTQHNIWGAGASLAEGRCPQPPPHLQHTQVGGKGGAGRTASGGDGFEVPAPFNPPQNIPATGRRRPPRKRLLCAITTPSAVPWIGCYPAGFCGCRWRQGEGVAPPMS